MTRYIGMDVHGQSTTLVVLGPSGRKLKEQVLETRGAVLREALRALARPRYLCMEEGMFSQWLYEELCDAVDELVVSQPSRHQGTKSDSVDAHRCADALRRDALERVVYKTRPGKYTELRLAVRGHQAVTRDHVRAKNRLRAFVRSRGVQANAALYDAQRRAPMLLGLPKTHRALGELYAQEVDQLEALHAQAEQWLLQEASRHRDVKRLSTAPGIGSIRAAQIVATVLCPYRFRTKRQFWSYCGLAVVTRSSADWSRGRHGRWERSTRQVSRGLNRNRHPMLKAAFKGAAMTVATRMNGHPLNDAYQRMLRDQAPHLARLTLARRLSAAVLAMWKHQQEYDVTQHLTAHC